MFHLLKKTPKEIERLADKEIKELIEKSERCQRILDVIKVLFNDLINNPSNRKEYSEKLKKAIESLEKTLKSELKVTGKLDDDIKKESKFKTRNIDEFMGAYLTDLGEFRKFVNKVRTKGRVDIHPDDFHGCGRYERISRFLSRLKLQVPEWEKLIYDILCEIFPNKRKEIENLKGYKR